MKPLNEIKKEIKDKYIRIYFDSFDDGGDSLYGKLFLEVLDKVIDELTSYITKGNREVDSMLVELWNFFALEKDHHGKQRVTGNIPSLNRLHYFVKSRGLIKGTGQFTEEGKLHLSQLKENK